MKTVSLRLLLVLLPLVYVSAQVPQCSEICGCNEVYSSKSGALACQPTCLKRINNARCKATKGCKCKDGYYREDSTMQCVPIDVCDRIMPSNCSLHETWSDSGIIGGCEKSCATLNVPIKCAPRKGCVCREGYVRKTSELGSQCILKEECGLDCPKGFIRQDENCIPNCVECPHPDLILNEETGVCADHCSNFCGQNEVFTDCGGAMMCQESCTNSETLKYVKCGCLKGCKCIDETFVRDPYTNKCIPRKTCTSLIPPKCPNVNEEWTNNASCQKNCADKKIDCSIKNGCVCKNGFIRETNDIRSACISEEQCKTGCPKGYIKNSLGQCVPNCNEYPANEEYSCGNPPCEATCENYGKPCKIIPIRCENKCYCSEGFVRDPITKQCVPLETCPKKCPANEVFDCANPYCEPTCETFDLPCLVAIKKCEDRCYCVEGYVRDPKTKQCLPLEKCDKKCPANEEYSCGNPHCEATCENYGKPCKIIPIRCEDRCYCSKGFVRDPITKQCVPVETCPQKCPENEVFACYNTECEPTCETFDLPCLFDIKKCENRCYCAEGYVRDPKTNQCTPLEKCPAKTCPANEEYSCTIPFCEPTCANNKEPCISKAKCEYNCYCAIGFVRDPQTKKCVLPAKCNQKCPANEEYSCGNPFCEPTCNNYGKPCNVSIWQCEDRCYCLKGFVRDPDTRQCIPVQKCNKCPANEVFACVIPFCEPTCENYGKPCNSKAKCEYNCYCARGYVRCPISKKCVPVSKCSDKCSVNEIFTCVIPSCEQTCANLGKPCTSKAKCEYNCYCAKGYVRDFNTKKCAPVGQCPKP